MVILLFLIVFLLFLRKNFRQVSAYQSANFKQYPTIPVVSRTSKVNFSHRNTDVPYAESGGLLRETTQMKYEFILANSFNSTKKIFDSPEFYR